jgi:molybdenum cofactor cytidylyltransferase
MPPRTDLRVTGLVLAAGEAKRLGQPKQLLPFGAGTLLDHTLDTARACGFDQVVCAIGGAVDQIRATVDLGLVDVVENHDSGEGCSSSIALALAAIDTRSDVLVLLLGDQPGVTVATVHALLDGRGDADLAVCRYENGRGHPFAFARSMFGELAQMHGDKAVWKLLDRHSDRVTEVPLAAPVPPDVDTWQDYDLVTRGERESSRTD